METIDFLSSHGDLSLDRSFKNITTIKIGGPIKYLVAPFDMNRLKMIMTYLKEEGIKYKLVGRGSNMVCGDEAYDGCVIKLEHLDHYSFLDDGSLYVEAGMVVPRLANMLATQGLSGLEFASGIPGTLGGLIYMNAGAYKKEMKDVVKEVLVYKDGEFMWLKNEDCAFSYRHSIFHEDHELVIVACKLDIVKGERKEIQALMADRLQRRRNTQPLDKPSVGSCFKNPSTDYAWRYIDGVGLRGYRYRGIEVSEKHPNWLLNIGDARAEDFIAKSNYIKDRVKAAYDVDLHMEVELFNC